MSGASCCSIFFAVVVMLLPLASFAGVSGGIFAAVYQCLFVVALVPLSLIAHCSLLALIVAVAVVLSECLGSRCGAPKFERAELAGALLDL